MEIAAGMLESILLKIWLIADHYQQMKQQISTLNFIFNGKSYIKTR